MQQKTYEVHYDEEADLLEIYLGEPTKCLAEEIEPGIFIRRDINTNEIKSVEIFDFKKRANILNETLKRINLSLPLSIGINHQE